MCMRVLCVRATFPSDIQSCDVPSTDTTPPNTPERVPLLVSLVFLQKFRILLLTSDI